VGHRVQLRARGNQHFVYSGRSVLITDLGGLVSGCGTEGFFVENTRLLSRLAISANGEPLKPIAVTPSGGDRLFAYYEVPAAGGVYLTVDTKVSERLVLILSADNFRLDGAAARVELALELEADFADAEEAEKGARQQQAAVECSWDGSGGELWFRYRHPNLDRAVRVRVSGMPSMGWNGASLSTVIELPARGKAGLNLEATPFFDGQALAGDRTPAARERLRTEIPRLFTSNDVVARAWKTATADLASMPFGHPDGPAAPIAGLPLYQQFFGRDTLTTAWQASAAMPSMLHDALTANAALVGSVVDDWYDEEPGKLIHQATAGPLAVLGLNNNLRNYGDYATEPDFLIMLGQYLAWTDDRDTVRSLLPVARRVVDWLERYADLDGDGLIEYQTRSPKGVKNQGWKDADDAIVDEQGRVIEPPIATVELQAYAYAGLQQAALAFALAGGDRAYALELLARAARLRHRINKTFWMPDQGFYAMAFGPDKQPVTSISSNPAHLLACGVAPRARARAVASRLMQADMFSGWGIRTLSADHRAFDPFSYHRGSVWPVENGTAALGFARYGLWPELHRLAEGLFALSDCFVEGRLPESAGGLQRDDAHPHPGIYPASCEPQSWSASMIVILIQSLLGMLPVAPLKLLIVDPHLPHWMPDLRLEGLMLGDAKVDLEVWRGSDGRTDYAWSARGPCRVVRQQPLNASAGIIRRLVTLGRSIAA
jgi:glycogen debranching enzyme